MPRLKKMEDLRGKADQELVQLTLQGETAAYDVLLEKHSSKIYKHLRKLKIAESDAYEIAQNAFLKAYMALSKFKMESEFYTWLSAIVRNTAYNYFRDRRKEYCIPLEDPDDEATPLDKKQYISDGHRVADPTSGVRNKEIKRRIYDALGKLSNEHREVVLLCEVEQLPYAEVSKFLGVPEGTLRSRLHHAKKQLQGLLSDLYD